MINALRIILSGSIPQERVKVYSHFMGDDMPTPDFFEDSQLVIECKQGTFVVPDYNVILIQLHCRFMRNPDGYRVARILLSDDLNYQDCYIIQPENYGKYGIPQVFREYEQLAFCCKDGLFITPDFQVQYIHMRK